MPGIALSELRAQARETADMVGSSFVTDGQVDKWLNRGIAEFYDLLCEHRGHEYFVVESSINIVSGTFEYDLPADFYQLLKATGIIDGVAYDLAAYDWGEFGPLGNLTLQNNRELIPPKYRLGGSLDVAGSPSNPQKIHITPDVGKSWVLGLAYLPTAPQLSADSDEMPTINYWHEYAILYSAERMLAKEESDISIVRGQRLELAERIKSRAPRRTADAPKVQRVRGRNNNRRGGL